MNRKRILIFMITLFSLVFLAACGNSQQETPASDVAAEETNFQEAAISSEPAVQKVVKIVNAKTFHDDLAWVEFEENGVRYTGWIDETGKCLYKTEGSFSLANFENGYAHISDDQYTYVVSDQGIICSRYPNDEVVACGYGYTWLAETSSGFESVHTTYTLFDPDRKELERFEKDQSEEIYNFEYRGAGIFSYAEDGGDYGTGVGTFYSVKTDQWINRWVTFSPAYWPSAAFQSVDGYLVIFAGYYSNSCFISYIDENGVGYDIDIPEEYGTSPMVCGVSQGFMLLYNDNGSKSFYYTVDLENQVFQKLTGEYADKIDWDENGGPITKNEEHCGSSFRDGIAAIALIGADGNRYYQLFDTSWNPIGDPIRANDMEVGSRDVLITTNLVVKGKAVLYGAKEKQRIIAYDQNGEELLNTETDGLNLYLRFADNIFVGQTEDNEYVYLTTDGEKLFDSLNASTAKEIDFSAVQ